MTKTAEKVPLQWSINIHWKPVTNRARLQTRPPRPPHGQFEMRFSYCQIILVRLPWWTTSASVMNCKWRWMNNELWATAMKSLTRRSLTNCSYDTICFCTENELLMMSKCLLWSTDTGYDSDYRWTNSEDEGCLVWQGVLYYPVCSQFCRLSRVWLVRGSHWCGMISL